jgi:hypothetical protein
MGTSAQIYIYIVIECKRYLIHMHTVDCDGHCQVDYIDEYMKALLQEGEVWKLGELLERIRSEYPPSETLIEADCDRHIHLLPTHDIHADTSSYRYLELREAYHSAYGDCYINRDAWDNRDDTRVTCDVSPWLETSVVRLSLNTTSRADC